MRALRLRPGAADLLLALAAGTLTVAAAYLAVRFGAEISVGALVALAALLATTYGFIAHPHLAIAATILIFTLIPALKVFVAGELGAAKDMIVFAAGVAAVIVALFERRRPDRTATALVALLLALYLINVGGGHGSTWLHGLRLVGEPLVLLLVGLTLPQPQRTFRYAMGSLIATCALVAAYGIVQQLLGKYALVELGYSFEEQVRSLPGGQLRSFGTLDDPFAYAALLALGLAGVIFWQRRGARRWIAGILIGIGLGLGFVRTSVLIVVAFTGLLLRRWGYAVSSILVVAAIGIAGIFVLVGASGTESHVRTYQVSGPGPTADQSLNVILNGRISAWEAALGSNPAEWLFGRGVGEVGTAAERAERTVVPSSQSRPKGPSQAVDSGYLATIADVGLIGLAILVLLLVWLFTLAWRAARTGLAEGWVALGLLTALCIDALTRASFTGFPTAFLALLLTGVCLASAHEAATATTTARTN